MGVALVEGKTEDSRLFVESAFLVVAGKVVVILVLIEGGVGVERTCCSRFVEGVRDLLRCIKWRHFPWFVVIISDDGLFKNLYRFLCFHREWTLLFDFLSFVLLFDALCGLEIKR